ncbi:UDP-N-acetylglucosamine 2-epimerase (hydrolyzing) [Idiomarina piscisalsi]|uniref:UDP-N-acetylglucosamine 2-epimerase (Hydrolyzing) n=1 Tax=Idiomarina piscisalsi TaxID=1096243 RepID=A0ABM6LV15_9GAMM|nr:UDP-N-acetylglucosamine 2-epimerase [Idiomarina piscisalsi]ASG66279.1 UDP-N-acetylglucosamine 2-epimerase (hydrolyzing) [Idiomarina piscisalsi]
MKVTVFTGTRADYGLLYWLLHDLCEDPAFHLQVIASGSHLSPEFGYTAKHIEQDGFKIDEKVEMLLSSDTAQGTVKSLGMGIIGYADALTRLQPDVVVILGDRYEALGIAQSAMLMRIPILHIHGGEITEGAYDDAIRHAITKLSYLHATATEKYRQRVIQLGETPERVFNVGALGLDHIARTELLDHKELAESLGFELRKDFFVVTYHPVTLADEPPVETFRNLTQALDNYPEFDVIFTYPNADDGGRQIIPLIEQYADANENRVIAIPSLGQQRYLSAIKHASAVIGNSSSGIIEVPSFNTPTVNIGQRQLGRLAAESVLHCEGSYDAIVNAIDRAVTADIGENINNPYGQGNASRKIIDILKSANLNRTKTFYDIGENQ